MSPVYDFIIVGGGTAGLVVANRLSENHTRSVLVLEAGDDLSQDPRVKIPLFFTSLLGSEADWAFQTEPQTNLNGRICLLNQGKALGGTSAINAQAFIPPGKRLIDSWGSLGNHGWNWNSLKPFLYKSYTGPDVEKGTERSLGIDGWTSRDSLAKGPIQTSFSGKAAHPIRQAWADTFKASGQYMSQNPFLSDPGRVGAFSSLASIDPVTRERSYAASAYYYPIKDRANLHVVNGAHVEKILFDSNGTMGAAEATGVRYIHEGKTCIAEAHCEIILAAGVFQSPKILELSGIGNADLLRKSGIQVIENLPAVGENLHDHLVCYLNYKASHDLETLDALIRQEPEALGKAMEEYATSQTGLLTSLGIYTYAFLPVPAKDQEEIENLVQQHQPPPGDNSLGHERDQAFFDIARRTLLDPKTPSGAYLTALGQTNFPKAANTAPRTPSAGKYLTLGVMLSQPLSRGTTHIRSGDPASPPVIDPRYLSHPLDIEVIARHMMHLKTIASSAPLNKLLSEPLETRDPAADFADLDAAKAFAKGNLISMWHMCGTCAMLPRDKAGVVDSQLKVYGTKNLRVVDASVMPLIPTANIQATVYAVAEKAADLIKETWVVNQ